MEAWVCDTDRRTHLPHRSDNISPLNSIRIFPWIKILSFSRDSPNLLYHGFPRRAVRVTRDRLALEKRGKKHISLFLSSLSFSGFVYILLITLTIAYLISFHILSLRCSLGGKGETTSPNLLPYFFCSSIQRASEQAIIGVFSFPWSRRASRSNTFYFCQERHLHAFSKPLHMHWEPGVLSTRWLVLFFLSFFPLLFSCSSAD